jgi:hypothetical protein
MGKSMKRLTALILVLATAFATAIWQVNDKLSFDVGLRHAFTNGRPVNEVRAGLTVGFPTGLFGKADRNDADKCSA